MTFMSILFFGLFFVAFCLIFSIQAGSISVFLR
uniref:Uncharacterized protein n=1 Tax=Anguilla anguilla TaxID=7936 RepID=A0A0E9RVV0_ANGAN